MKENSPISIDQPIRMFSEWYKDAQETEESYPEAMSLSTVGEDGYPDVRIVLLKDYSKSGFVFYTNYDGKKGFDLTITPKAGLCFYWKHTKRQIRIKGDIIKVSPKESDDYFASRPRASQIGAWASKQSKPMNDELELEREVAKFAIKFGFSKIPRPDNWGGFKLIPNQFEFWEERLSRLHKRTLFVKIGGDWNQKYLFP